MKRWLALTVVALLWTPPAVAQKYDGEITISLQSGMGVAVASFSHDYTYAVQGVLQNDYVIVEGTSVGLRAGYQLFNTEDGVHRNNVKVAHFAVQGKHFFSPDARLGPYGVAGWGVFWWKEDLPKTLSEPAWGGFGGLGLHYEATETVAFFGEVTYNGFFAEPDGITFFSFGLGATIGLSAD